MNFDLESVAAGPGVWVGCDLDAVVRHCRFSLVYLATPYSKRASHADGTYCATGAARAAFSAAGWAAVLAADGVTVVSPIVQAQAMIDADVMDGLDPLDAVFWESWCRPLLAASAAVVVPPMVGRRESLGVQIEVQAALAMQKQIFILGADARPQGFFK